VAATRPVPDVGLPSAPDPLVDVHVQPQRHQLVQFVRAEVGLVAPWRYLGPPVTIRFPVANASTEVRHLVGEVPDGFVVIDADATITRAPGSAYSKVLAYLQANMANATAVLQFGCLRQGVTDVNAR
jgi:hypothetical protein